MMHYYRFHVSDYRKDTAHLSPTEHYIYRTLIDWYFLDERPIPSDIPTILRRLGLSNDRSRDVQQVFNDFFTVDGDCCIHARIEADIRAYRKQIDGASRAGKASAALRKSNKTEALQRAYNDRTTTVQPTSNHKPITKNQETTAKAKPSRFNPLTRLLELGVTETTAGDWLTLRKAKRATVTETALAGIVKEAGKAGITLQAALELCCQRGWQGFEAGWINGKDAKTTATPPAKIRPCCWEGCGDMAVGHVSGRGYCAIPKHKEFAFYGGKP